MVLHIAAIVTLISGANGIINLFDKGLKISQKIKEIKAAEREAERKASARQRREDRKLAARQEEAEKKSALEEIAFEASLASAPPRIRAEYDIDFKRLGPVFEQGDDIARERLKDIIISLQTKLLAVLETSVFSKNFSTFNYANLQDSSDSSRVRTLTTLAQCFQRLSVRAPIRPSLSTKTSSSQPAPSVPISLDSSNPLNLRIALFDFKSDEVGDLTFKKGEIITVIMKAKFEEDLWWKGQIGTRTGIFPLNYTKEYTSQALASVTHPRPEKKNSKAVSKAKATIGSLRWPLLSSTSALCPGALALQNSYSKGFTLTCVVPKPDKNGHTLWAYGCNHCKFKHEFRDRQDQQRKVNEFPFEEVGVFKTKMRLKWTFLAMSHKPETSIFSNSKYYCVFCITESNSPDMFKLRNESTLKSHIHDDHRNGEALPS